MASVVRNKPKRKTNPNNNTIKKVKKRRNLKKN